ncbi:hypothetical protein K474DRAFT_135474 [Panus rudis PR-1116 ss-1]|nr:hypothetical protein K474DRAFT_135474 [Panus rudis PR-1116 ss-1]
MLSVLPADISLHILSFLSLSDIANLHLTSRGNHRFLADHESEVYHQLAVSYRYVSPGTSLHEAIVAEYPSSWLNGTEDWKDFFRRWTILERNWSGHGTVLEGGYTSPRDFALRVRQFAVDETDGTVLTTIIFGSMLTVHAIEDNRRLWSLPEVRHFDWSDGFLAFVNQEGGVDVWRRSTDVYLDRGQSVSTPLVPPSPLAASMSQFERAADSHPIIRHEDSEDEAESTKHTYEDLRGQYTPHACIRAPNSQSTRRFRLSFPIVALATNAEDYIVHLYDIAKGEYIRSINIYEIHQTGNSSLTGHSAIQDAILLHLELSEHCVIACYDSAVVVLPIREEYESKYPPLILTEEENSMALQQSVPQLRRVRRLKRQTPHGDLFPSFIVEEPGEHTLTNSVKAPGYFAMEKFKVVPPSPEAAAANAGALVIHGDQTRISPCFASAAISPDERHLVVVTGFGLLYLFPDFTRISKGLVTPKEIAQIVHFGSSLSSISWGGHSSRFAVKTEEGDTYLVDLDPTYHNPTLPDDIPRTPHNATRTSNPRLSHSLIHRFADFRMSNLHQVFTNMQLTKTRLWLLWDPVTLHNVVLTNERTRAMRGRTVMENAWADDEWEDSSPLPKFNPRDYSTSVCFIDFTSGVH